MRKIIIAVAVLKDKLSEISVNPKESVPLTMFYLKKRRKKSERVICSCNEISFHTLFSDYGRLVAWRRSNRRWRWWDRHVDDSNEWRLNHHEGEGKGTRGIAVPMTCPSRTSDPNFSGPLWRSFVTTTFNIGPSLLLCPFRHHGCVKGFDAKDRFILLRYRIAARRDIRQTGEDRGEDERNEKGRGNKFCVGRHCVRYIEYAQLVPSISCNDCVIYSRDVICRAVS